MASVDNQRRNFLKQGSAALGGLLASPRAAILGALAAGAAAANEAGADEGVAPTHPRKILRSGEPINTAGHPFGSGISGWATVEGPSAKAGSRLLLVLGHSRPSAHADETVRRKSVGLSILEFNDTNKKWEHALASSLNRRWHLDTPLPIEGMRLVPEQAAHRHQALASGVGSVSCTLATPWNTVLCGEEWVVEVNPLTGSAVKRFSVGRVRPVALAILTMTGLPVRVYLVGHQGHLFKFVSHQRFDGRMPQANHSMLSIGELFVADVGTGRWVPLTTGLNVAEWEVRLADPYLAADFPAPGVGETEGVLLTARFDGADPVVSLSSSEGALFVHEGAVPGTFASTRGALEHPSAVSGFFSVETQNADSTLFLNR